MKDNIQILISESVELLKEMVAIPSVSFSEADVCTLISSWLTEKGVEHRRDGNNLIAEHISNPDSPTLMLCAHIDTVAASNEYSFDPHKPDYIKAAETISSYIAEGKIPEAPCSQATPENIVAGLGSNDDGASVVSMIAVFRYFKSMTISPNIMLVLSCEEERSGINGMTGLWHRIKDKVDYAIVGEPTGMKAATAERGLLVIDASAHGISGHAARNEGLNAIHIALEDIERLRTHEFTKISPRMGKVNLNVTQINAGTAHNVIPDLCTFVIDTSYRAIQQRRDIERTSGYMPKRAESTKSEQSFECDKRRLHSSGYSRQTRNRYILFANYIRLDANRLRCHKNGTGQFIALT